MNDDMVTFFAAIIGLITVVVFFAAGAIWVITGTDGVCTNSGYQKIQAEAK